MAAKGIDELGPAIGVDEVIAAVHGCRHAVSPPCRGDAEGDGQHNSISVGDHGEPHRVLGVVTVGHLRFIGQRRSGQVAADAGDVDDVMRRDKPRRTAPRVFEFISVALTVIERNEMDQRLFIGDLV